MSVGVPYVATPVGGSAEIGVDRTTHLFATTNEEWYRALDSLLMNAEGRREMGIAGRRHAVENYGLEAQADKLADALREAAS
jgi:glycosyltransferase involved in cell wall biosynthesis